MQQAKGVSQDLGSSSPSDFPFSPRGERAWERGQGRLAFQTSAAYW